MDGRYSYETEGPRRCGICGGIVHEETTFGQMSIADTTPPIETVRICQTPKCNSNTGRMSITDVV